MNSLELKQQLLNAVYYLRISSQICDSTFSKYNRRRTFNCPVYYPLRLPVDLIFLFTYLEMDWKCIFGEHLPLSEVKMGAYYMNYYFHNIEYDDGFYGGEFSAPDYRVYCKFLYDRKTKEFIDIWDNTQPIDEILPIPIWWLDNKLEKNGKLGKHESKVSI